MFLNNNYFRYDGSAETAEIITELRKLTHRNSRTDDELLKFIDAPVRLEFLSAIALVKYFDIIVWLGKMAERLNAAVLKTVEVSSLLGFESLSFRQKRTKSEP